ncbi:hypothetical protein LCGC14_1693420 [marine sediment metagenome]|uniref:Uncharacterized protein n=1 Tax=marine sediment metagenome TaxID=412755 RepID=A0A0F9KK74_9ZZZZ
MNDTTVIHTGDGDQADATLNLSHEQLKELYQGDHFMKDRELVKDHFFQKYWRPAMAGLYMLLMILDYGVRPLVNQYHANEFDLSVTVEAIAPLDPSVQVKALDIASRNEIWPPILNEFVHLAFGAILTAAATTRGFEKVKRLDKGKK